MAIPLDPTLAPADRAVQMARLRAMLTAILPTNPFYLGKFANLDPSSIRSADDLQALPFTTKAELAADQAGHPPYGRNLTYRLEQYTRFHQTSGTSSGRPLRWLDTQESWDWVTRCWTTNFRLLGLQPGDRLFFPFSFGPFLGFWSAFDAATRAGFLSIPGGGMSSSARVRCLIEHRCTIVFATPTYALHLAEVAAKEGLDLAGSPVRAVVVAGEPGGNIPATRECIERGWGAKVFDHYGMTEIGPVATESSSASEEERTGPMYLLESDYLPEVVDPATGQAVGDGESGELVLTNLGRLGSPLIRYRTGDLVRIATTPDPSGRSWRRLEGGILGRVDDMIHIRGNNLYPSAIEAVVRRFADVAEYRINVDRSNPLTDVWLELEPVGGDGRALAEAVGRAVKDELLFRVEVKAVAPGTLPRFEMKARRITRNDR